MLSVMSGSVPREEEVFIHLFCLFSKTNRGHGYPATLAAPCPLRLNFKLGGFTLPTFMVTSKPCLNIFQTSRTTTTAPQAKSDYLDFKRLNKLQLEWKKSETSKSNFFESSCVDDRNTRMHSPTCGFFWRTLDGAIQLVRKLKLPLWDFQGATSSALLCLQRRSPA